MTLGQSAYEPCVIGADGRCTRFSHNHHQAGDSWCDDCQKPLSEHDHCARSDVLPGGCGHYACDCICDFLRDEWPTHPNNPEAR